MNLCSDNHDEICHESRACPLCEMRDVMDNEITHLTQEVNELNKDITDLQEGEQ